MERVFRALRLRKQRGGRLRGLSCARSFRVSEVWPSHTEPRNQPWALPSEARGEVDTYEQDAS